MEIMITKNAEKSLKRLDVATRNRIIKAIKNLPYGDIKRLQGLKDEVYRLRVGNYRIIYMIRGNTAFINEVLPRGSVYKRI